MECQRRRVYSLVVLTLLQLCRAEIKDSPPQWYSANIINDGFQPKSISELFSTETPFSTANPIIVSSNSDDDIRLLSTLTPSTILSSSPKLETSTFPSSSQSSQFSSYSPTQSPLPEYSSTATPFQQYTPPRIIQNQQTNQPSVEIQQQSSPADYEAMQPMLKIITKLQTQSQRNLQIQQDQPTSTQRLPQNLTVAAFYPLQPTETIPQGIQYALFPQNSQTSSELDSSTARPSQNIPPQSNYFLIYQQAPQSIQSYPNRVLSPRSTVRDEPIGTTRALPVSSTLVPTFSSPSTFSSPTPTFSPSSSTFSSSAPSISTIPSFPATELTSPLFFSTTAPPSTQFLPSTPPRVTVTPLSTFGSSSSVGSSSVTRNTNCMLTKSTTPLPMSNTGRPIPIDQLFPLKIRVIAPSGSITNVNFKPQIMTQKEVVKTTTRKPTTRRPTTKKTPKPRKNTYERCLQGCRKNGQSLCAAPLSQFPVDPKNLRGFPSVCHMACHNSYRKDAFEKIIDGSCSKLRTRIRPVDSNSKLKRDELQKVQYFIDNPGQQTIFEFAGGSS